MVSTHTDVVPTKVSMYDQVEDFIKKSTEGFDSSHDYKHAIIVYLTARRIMDSFEIEYDYDILMFAALLHDVRDHKYPKSISETALRDFIKLHVPNKVDIIMKIIDNTSYSREVRGKREKLDFPYNLYLDSISDADKLQALGAEGIRRCEAFTIASGGKVPDDTVQHCHDKLLRLYPDGFIRTDLGKKLAKPLHDEIVEYVAQNSKPIA